MMDNLTTSFLVLIAQLLVLWGFFAVLVYVTKFALNKIKTSNYFKESRFFNPYEYLPEEELDTIKQVYYLVMIVIMVMGILYLLFDWSGDLSHLLIFDIAISLYLSTQVEGDSFKNKLILFFLIPLGSLSHLIFNSLWLSLLDLFHCIVFAYFIKQYYKKFFEYTEDNSLGITIMLLFLIVFVSFLITIVVEGVSPIDSIAMVSNAFTSNGYAVLGSTGFGKLNAIFLVWSGFVLSGVGTATLTVAIVMSHVNDKFNHLEDLVKKNKKD